MSHNKVNDGESFTDKRLPVKNLVNGPGMSHNKVNEGESFTDKPLPVKNLVNGSKP